MTHLPKLAIVGRPNVGKSALFNRISKKKIAIVDEAEGITRDRLYSKAEFFGTPFEVIDTGGMDYHSNAVFNEHILRQAEIAVEEADTLVMVVDAHVGITKLDKEIAQILLKTKKPICLAVNKIDNMAQEQLLHEFHSLGIKKMVPVSAAQGWHIAELLETAFESFNKDDWKAVDDPAINVAIVGRPNVGKSSLINFILDEERCIVSPIPGTTRDSIDVSVTQGEDLYRLIDTAGIRRKHAEHEVVDKFAAIRTERAIERADICVLMLDAQAGMTTQDKKIANTIEEAGKGCIIVFNKWDLVKGFRMEHCLQGINEEAAFLRHCPKLFMSATTGRNVEKLFELIKEVKEESLKRISTHQLNKFIENSMQKNHPPMIMGKRLRIYYMVQVGIQPPKFIVFVNYPNLMTEPYKKYLYNQFRETYGFTGLPLIMHLKGKKKSKNEKQSKPHTHHEESNDIEEEFHENEEIGWEDQGDELW
ncbi:MAG: ribosome biogenesis GTPase Der [Chlamydiales bacterium 38-26]|nr:ribosome biogenesis GTPase Der [Chlamydiales bacterium]OJV10997.1 MAG: ribosome biogenesis GTPase Der [Chlamydiales bacterium 38-26]